MMLETARISARSLSLPSRTRRKDSATAKVPMRLSNALAMARSLRRSSKGTVKVIGSPTRMSRSAWRRLATPMSINKSSILGAFRSESLLVKWGATLPTTPLTGPPRA